MIEENDNRTRDNSDTTIGVIILKVCILAIFIYPLAHYSIFVKKNLADTQQLTNKSSSDNTETATIIQRAKPAKKQPTSNFSSYLGQLCLDLYVKKHQCLPEDITNLEKHKPPKQPVFVSSGETRGNIVGFLVAGLLVMSLVAALLELYKAKHQTPAKARAPFSRKCSLADLTVLKHNRKELVRRESILEEDSGNSANLPGRMVSRPPLRLE